MDVTTVARPFFQVTTTTLIAWGIGALLIAFALFKFFSGRKKLKAKKEAEKLETESQTGTSEEEEEEY